MTEKGIIKVTLGLSLFLVIIGWHGYSYDCFLSRIGSPEIKTWGRARCLRSDDWSTALSINYSQYISGFPKVNPAVGNMRMGLLPIPPAAPVAEFWTIFRPQSWGYFIDFDTGASFSWVFGASLLFLSAFAVSSFVLKAEVWTSLLLSIWLYFLPIVQFWSGIPNLFLGHFFFIWFLIHQLTNTENRKKKILYCVGISWSATALALLLYTPFLIPITVLLALVGLIYFVTLPRIRIYLLATGAFCVSTLVLFFFDLNDAIQIIIKTDYPGARRHFGGDMSLEHWFSNLIYSLRHGHPDRVGSNLSEAASVPHFIPFITLLLLARAKSCASATLRRITFTIIFVSFGLLYYCVFGLPPFFAKFTLFEFTLPTRAMLLAAPLMFISYALITSQSLYTYDKRNDRPFKFFVIAATFVALVGIVWTTKANSSVVIAYALLNLFSFSALLLLKGNYRALPLAAISIFNTFYFNPISLRGLEYAIESSPNLKKIRALNPSNLTQTSILVNGDAIFDNILKLAPVPNYAGDVPIPNPSFIQQFDPNLKYKKIWNRYAHIQWKINNTISDPLFTLIAPDQYLVELPPRSIANAGLNVIEMSELENE